MYAEGCEMHMATVILRLTATSLTDRLLTIVYYVLLCTLILELPIAIHSNKTCPDNEIIIRTQISLSFDLSNMAKLYNISVGTLVKLCNVQIKENKHKLSLIY